MNIVVTNDDGPFAPCLNVLPSLLRELGTVNVVVPNQERSTSGHGLTLNRPLGVQEISSRFFIVDGLPADCALWGSTAELLGKVDVVISGINRGGNLGQDIYYSGTVAAAREAAFRSLPSLAVSLTLELSHRKEQGEEDYLYPSQFIKRLLEKEVIRLIPPLFYLNINFPATTPIKGAMVTTLGFRQYGGGMKEMSSPRNRPLYWPDTRYEGFLPIKRSDCQTIDNHFISVTPIGPLPSSVYPFSAELEDLLQNVFLGK